MIPLQVALNSVATESFRDQADRDYILARVAWRLRMRDQFLWSAQQALEKYLKAILLFNGESARYPQGSTRKEFGHSLTRLYDAVEKVPGLVMQHPKWWRSLLERIEVFGQNRYLTHNSYTMWDWLEKLDEAVWSIRRYCQHMRFSIDVPSGGHVDMLPKYLKGLNAPELRQKPHTYRLLSGELERILGRPRTDQARQALVRQNRYFGARARRTVRYGAWSGSVVAPVQRDWAQEPQLRAQLTKFFKFD